MSVSYSRAVNRSRYDTWYTVFAAALAHNRFSPLRAHVVARVGYRIPSRDRFSALL